MIYLIDPKETTLPVCPLKGCQKFCGIKPLYGIPI